MSAPVAQTPKALERAEQLLARTVRGASLLVLLVAVQRLLTFGLNALLIRAADPAVLGFASNDMELLLSTVLFLSRESFRLAALRHGPDATLARSEQAERRSVLVNLAWAPVPLGLLLAGGAAALLVLTPWGSAHLSADQRRASLLYCAAAAVETLAEPFFILGQSAMLYSLRVSVEVAGVVLKVGTTYTLIVFAGMGADAFGAAQLAFAVVVFVGYLGFFLRRRRDASSATEAPENPVSLDLVHQDPFPSQLSSAEGPAHSWAAACAPTRWIPAPVWRLVGAFMSQGVVKHFLTEGDHVLLLLFGSNFDKGVYLVVTNYGSLAVRLLFQPVEDASRTLFSKLLAGLHAHDAKTVEHEANAESEAKPVDEDTSTATTENPSSEKASELRRRRRPSSADAAPTPATSTSPTYSPTSPLSPGTPLASVVRARTVFQLMLGFVLLVGLFFLVFGPHYTRLLVHVLMGPRYAATDAAAGLAVYCVYVFTLAANGLTEAFVHAVASERDIASQNARLGLSFLVYALAAVGGLHFFGMPGLVAAGCVNMLLRAASSWHFAKGFFLRHGVEPLQIADVFPSGWTLATFAAALAAMATSARALDGDGWRAMGLHVGVGLVCLVVVVAVLAVRERGRITSAWRLFRSKRDDEA